MAGSDNDAGEEIAISVLKFLGGVAMLVIGGIAALLKIQSDRRRDSEFTDLLHRSPPDTKTSSTPSSPLLNIPPEQVRFIRFIGLGLLCVGIAILAYGFVIQRPGRALPPDWGVAALGLIVGGTAVVMFARAHTPLVEDAPPEVKVEAAPDAPPSSPTYMFTITLPKHTTWDAPRALHFMEQILDEFGTLVFEIVADYTSIRWRIIDMNARVPDPIERSIRAAYPDADIAIAPLELYFPPYPHYRYVALYQHDFDFIAPIRFVTDTKSLDPLAQLVQAMDSLQPDERVSYTLVTIGWAIEAKQEAERLMTRSGINFLHLLTPEGRGEAILRTLTNTDRVVRYNPEDMKVLMDKYGQRLYQAVLFIQVDSPHKERIPQLINIDSHLVNFGTPYNAIVRFAQNVAERTIEITDAHTAIRLSSLGVLNSWAHDPTNSKQNLRRITRLILDPRELALLWHLPHAGFAARRIQWMNAHQVEVPTTVTSAKGGIEIGKGVLRGKRIPVYLKPEDRTSHIWIMGKTGFGKSSLMYQMITQDIAAGHGVAVVDPHGTLVQDVLRCGIPPQRADDVVVLDLADNEHPVPLNLLRGKLEFTRIGQIISIIERLFPDTAEYARLSRYLRASITLASEDLEATLVDVIRIFRDDAYREQLIAKTSDDDLALTWEEYGRFKDGERSRILEPIHSRLSAFIGNPFIRPLICHPNTIDFRTLIQQKKIILISLKMDELQVPELEQNILGAMLVSQLQLSGMMDAQSPYYLYIDEVQRFVTSSLKQLFSEARKFNLSLTVAHQFTQQLENDTVEAISGNAGMSVFFQLSPRDAQAVHAIVAPEFHTDDLVNFDKYQAVVKMPSDSSIQPAFTLFTNPPPTKAEKDASAEREVRLRRESHGNWTPKTTHEVKEWLKQRYRRPVQADDQSQFMDAP